MAKHFTFHSTRTVSLATKTTEPRKFAEPSREQIKKAKETWKRLAPKEARGMIK